MRPLVELVMAPAQLLAENEARRAKNAAGDRPFAARNETRFVGRRRARQHAGRVPAQRGNDGADPRSVGDVAIDGEIGVIDGTSARVPSLHRQQ